MATITKKSSHLMSVGEAAKFVAGTVIGDVSYNLDGMTAIGSAKENELTVVCDDKDVTELFKSDAECVLTNEELSVFIPSYCNVIVVKDVTFAADLLAKEFSRRTFEKLQ